MAPSQKGKQATKGGRQIVEENKATLSFYKKMAFLSTVVSVLINFVIFETSKVTVIMSLLAIVALSAAYQFMAFMANPKYNENGTLMDSGNDLNMEGGIAENVKDLIILTSGTLLLALVSNYFWLLLLLAPIRAFWMLWSAVIQPWLIQRKSTEEQEVDEKKHKKMERRMRRMR